MRERDGIACFARFIVACSCCIVVAKGTIILPPLRGRKSNEARSASLLLAPIREEGVIAAMAASIERNLKATALVRSKKS